jgi:hypothetical protein
MNLPSRDHRDGQSLLQRTKYELERRYQVRASALRAGRFGDALRVVLLVDQPLDRETAAAT